MTTIRIGTRKSSLAMVQTNLVAEAIRTQNPDIRIEIVPMSTKGDEILDRPLLSFGGKGAFITEFEKALLDGTIDLA
ncbi:MAG: hydroxymethylbilane synthase, partial [Lachnospiraceae bacterium]